MLSSHPFPIGPTHWCLVIVAWMFLGHRTYTFKASWIVNLTCHFVIHAGIFASNNWWSSCCPKTDWNWCIHPPHLHTMHFTHHAAYREFVSFWSVNSTKHIHNIARHIPTFPIFTAFDSNCRKWGGRNIHGESSLKYSLLTITKWAWKYYYHHCLNPLSEMKSIWDI